MRRVVTANRDGISLVSETGEEGSTPAKIRSLHPGDGIKLINTKDSIEVRSSIFNVSKSGYNLFDPKHLFLRALLPGPGIRLDIHDEHLILSCDALTQSSKCNLLTPRGRLKSIKAGKYIKMTEDRDEIVINNDISVLDAEGVDIFHRGVIRKINIVNSHVSITDGLVEFTPKILSWPGDCSLVSNNKIKTLKASRGIDINSSGDSLHLVLNDDFIKQFSRAIGEKGPIGPRGIEGKRGPIGLKGEKGDSGAVGPTGPVGETGNVGPQGPAGQPGLNGETGPQGDRGPQGPRGEIGPVGPHGPQGLIGIAGPQGLQGKDGKRGPNGEKGEKGERGEKGDTVNISNEDICKLINSSIQSKSLFISKSGQKLTIETPHKNCGSQGAILKNDNRIKTITCDKNIEIIDKGDSLFISTEKLSKRIEQLEKRLKLIEKI